MPCSGEWHLQRLKNTKLAVFCSPHTAVEGTVFERKRVWLQRHVEIYWWVHGVFQKQASHSSHLTQATYFRGWFHAEHWVWVGSSGWAWRGRSSCFDCSETNRLMLIIHEHMALVSPVQQSQVKLTSKKKTWKSKILSLGTLVCYMHARFYRWL